MHISISSKVVVPVLLAVHAFLLGYSLRFQFATRNEVAHVPAGLSHWSPGTFSLYSVNPPLWRMIAVLPVFFAHPNMDGIQVSNIPGVRDEWAVARRFADDNALNYHTLICLARIAGILWSVGGGLLIYRWAADVYGRTAGYLGLVIWCFEPSILAHAQLVTPDLPSAVAALAATYLFFRYLRVPDMAHAFSAGVLLGIAELTKFTLLLLYPVWMILGIVAWASQSRHSSLPVPLRWRLAHGLLIIFVSVLMINAGYAFDRTMLPLGDYHFVSKTFRSGDKQASIPSNRFRGTWLASIPVPLPADYLLGIDLQRRDLEGEEMPHSFLAGEWRDHGWWYYYLYGLAIKVPLGTLALVFWSLALLFVRHQANARLLDECTIWLIPLIILIAVSSQTGFNHHLRYVLSMYPFVAIGTAKLAFFFYHARRACIVAVMLLLVWSIASSLSIYPHSLSYFNEMIGGPNNGHKHLADSNIDWGQDLFFFTDWARRHSEAAPIALAYYNYIDPRVCGVDFASVPPDPFSTASAITARTDRVGPYPGYYAIDLYNIMEGPYRYFGYYQPIAKAGYSIFIYHITPEQADYVRRKIGLTPLSAPFSP